MLYIYIIKRRKNEVPTYGSHYDNADCHSENYGG